MKKIIISIFLIWISLFFFSCEEDFTPYVKGDTSYMFFSVLDSRSDAQFAFLNRSCFYGNITKMPENLKLVLAENGGKNYVFQDTVLPGLEAYSCFYLKGLKLKHGSSYKFTSIADSLVTQYGELTYFPAVTARFVDTVIKDPYYKIREGSRVLLGYINRPVLAVYLNKPKGFFGDSHMYIEYELKYGDRVVAEKKEIPVSLGGDPALSYIEGDEMRYWSYNYSDVSATYQSHFYLDDSYNGRIHFFRDYDEILYTLKYINPHMINASAPKPDEITIKRAYLVFIYIDKNVYFFSRATTDYSIRLDESYYYTNIYTDNGPGHGFVGANGADTLEFKLKQELLDEFGYKNGQK